MARIISVVNQKGGTGKTTSVVNISAYLARMGYKTLILDMDPQASATLYLGVDPSSVEFSMYDVLLKEAISFNDIILSTGIEKLHLAPAHVSLAKTDINLADNANKQYRLKEKLADIKAKYDYILIDCPPSLSLLPINALTCSSEVIIPLQPKYLSLEGLKQLKSSLDRIKSELNPLLKILGILFTMVDMRPKMTKHGIDLVRKHFGNEVFDSIIRICSKFNEAPIAGQSIFDYNHNSKGAEDYKRVTEEVINKKRIFYRRGISRSIKVPKRIKRLFNAT
ncbi:MAG: ParA family protein [Candidatus Omnitrophota bacterium]|nr:MAG: ParA family protein [Candidatus Omnitrophota bacterium]